MFSLVTTEKFSVKEAKQIMDKYSATVYYVTHTSFTTIEAAISDRGKSFVCIQALIVFLRLIFCVCFVF